MSNICIIWDMENVTPPGNNSLFIDSLQEYAENLGRVVSAKAYADWSAPNFAKLAFQLKKYQFYLVHVPSERKKKNSVDIQLVSDTLENLRLYEHIDTYVLVTGDSDFRPLLLTLRRAGKMTHIVCDIKTASQELLSIADSFIDYRDILPADEDEDDAPGPVQAPTQKVGPEFWFSALTEAVGILAKEGKPVNVGNVKMRMKMLNPNFDEKHMGYKRWGDFISAAVRHGVIQLIEKDGNPEILLAEAKENREVRDKGGDLQKALKALVESLGDLDSGREAQFHEYSLISSRMRERKIDLKTLGYSQFKKFLQAADLRGLVETRTEGVSNYAKLNAN
ncbi:MAG: NYN domain-containing protein [Spirochaetales bacterium]